jgi:hypothetical protein
MLAAANAFWILFLLPIPGLHQEQQKLFFETPSEEALKKLESQGVARNVVTQFLQNINGSYKTGNHINFIMQECDDRFREGNLTREVFAACAVFTISYTKHLQQVIDENLQPLSVITSGK